MRRTILLCETNAKARPAGSKVAIQMLKTNRLLTDFHEFSRAAGLLELTGGEADSVTDANGARRIGRAIK